MTDCLTKFEPTDQQQTLLEVFQGEDYDITVSDACKAVGVSRETYYVWMRIEGFRGWWISEAERFFTLQKTTIFASILKAATNKVAWGSAQDRKLFLERFDKDYMPKSRRELEHSGAVPVNLKDMSTEELERQAHAMGLREPGPSRTILQEQGIVLRNDAIEVKAAPTSKTGTFPDKPNPSPMPESIPHITTRCAECKWTGPLSECRQPGDGSFMCPNCTCVAPVKVQAQQGEDKSQPLDADWMCPKCNLRDDGPVLDATWNGDTGRWICKACSSPLVPIKLERTFTVQCPACHVPNGTVVETVFRRGVMICRQCREPVGGKP